MTGVEVAFALMGLVAVGAGLLVVTTPRLVHAGLWLAVSLAALAGCYLLLTAEFVAWVQVLIYVGAVIVVVLFALMLTRAPTGPSAEPTAYRRGLAALVALATAGVLLATLQAGFGGEVIDLEAAEVGDGTATGAALFRTWVLPFEVLSVLLLAALVGAITLSRRSPDGEEAAR
ncbi:MAG TPA: NADH-quinone oxidoreductase subunit J [Jiangellales bacterium]|nr:NADH-quinone oxidoreductase subunit J [Jiangellales bacterium]